MTATTDFACSPRPRAAPASAASASNARSHGSTLELRATIWPSPPGRGCGPGPARGPRRAAAAQAGRPARRR
eukprot:1867232-Pyramimonas_sp.AAC.1